MKKITALTIAIAISLSLTACGGVSDKSVIGRLIGQNSDTNKSTSVKSETEITTNDKKENDVSSTETFTTAKIEKDFITETSKSETSVQNAEYTEEKKTFKFDGGKIECVEYKYYGNYDDSDDVIEYINVSAKVKLDNYPDSEKAINDVLSNNIFHDPTKEELMASKAPQSADMIIIFSYSHLISVCLENHLLFISTNYANKNRDYEDCAFTLESTYVFDIRTGSQLEIEQCFKNFDEIEELVYIYSPMLIMGYIDMNNYKWYYDGKNFTFKFDAYGEDTYDETVSIPADDIRPYFASESGSVRSGGSTKLVDIVGMGVYPKYINAPDIEVNVTLADISQSDRKTLLKDLKYDVGMFEAIKGRDKSLFYEDEGFLGTSDINGDTLYYYDTYFRTFQDLAAVIRSCFTESFLSDEEIENITGGIDIFSAFGYSPQTIAWEFYPPAPSYRIDFENAGVVMYSNTEAEVWVAESSPIEATFDVEIFKMTRLDSNDRWKIDKMLFYNNGNINNN